MDVPLPVLYPRRCRWLPWPCHERADGRLCVGEADLEVPFAIRRVYTLTGLDPKGQRADHAHRQTQQVLVCAHGNCQCDLDDGGEQQTVILEHPAQALYMGPGVWHRLHTFSPNCVLLVLASEFYDDEDYLKDYDEFRAWLQAHDPAAVDGPPTASYPAQLPG